MFNLLIKLSLVLTAGLCSYSVWNIWTRRQLGRIRDQFLSVCTDVTVTCSRIIIYYLLFELLSILVLISTEPAAVPSTESKCALCSQELAERNSLNIPQMIKTLWRPAEPQCMMGVSA